jgi:cytochrome o ubiquinol oxidase subunit 1
VWLHHFFTMGSGANVNAFFGIATMMISIPTGVKIFNWLFTMYRGRIRFTTPMLWTVGFIVTFTIGGMTGVMLAVPGADFLLHNSLFLIAHFHNVIIGGVLFGYVAGMSYWFPKSFGFRLHEGLGKVAFWCWLVGFYVAFMPLYVLGFMGMTRRMQHYDNAAWQAWLIVAAVGAVIIAAGIGAMVLQIAYSVWKRDELRDTTGDPWGGRTLEWMTDSPPPFYNFAHAPVVHTLDALSFMKERGEVHNRERYAEIHMPRNTAVGLVMGLLSIALGFGLIWHIWWLGVAGFVGMIVAFIARSFDEDVDYYVPVAEVERIENNRHLRLATQG